MKTIQMTLDEELLNRVDKLIKEHKTTRSASKLQQIKSALLFALGFDF